ncbi:hypothetical protein [Trueperella pyogenes]|uniref:Integrase catalytic domain-containing protein n=1 Tax=Trueperella pyogenes TaxID=1661 RepID=A0A2S0RND2_9ACTO|nr:hypothetical protein [Trueperella pyogenes]AWA44210.1 hypothetical protein DBV13_09515 [Trueperella pyogenes]AZR07447.1 hypothetical protein EBQ10_09240 [Trueperella pyogenes]MBB3025175.1 putative transposase [Trueperella pyogenes]PIN50839.1 hypothetical protein CT171_09830 [Trueperella pyogenes]QIU87667.1 transposase family protein [Trueperella pyogenes]
MHGKTLKICNILDEYTREHVAFTVDKEVDMALIIELLDLACLKLEGKPQAISIDHETKFIANDLET